MSGPARSPRTEHQLPVDARDAATVLLLRDGAAGIETWLMRRVPKMAFAPGFSVFPGGGVDPADAAGPELPEVAARFSIDPALAGVIVRAALREIIEETGVRLAPADLRPWARWITPEAETRRYDTYFFAAALPDGQDAAGISTEAAVAEWLPVAEALRQYEAGERPMLPPTVHNLQAIARFDSVTEALASAAARTIRTIMPTLRPDADGRWVADLGNGELVPLPAGFVSATGRPR
ncbi:MAG TPA: NUDIX hydrolase [Jatrophihabitans sp.]|nr:NUDIX hydrolase [Jatrophihabitans sp.]